MCSLVLSCNGKANQGMDYNHLLIVVLEADEIQSTCLHDNERELSQLFCTFKYLSYVVARLALD